MASMNRNVNLEEINTDALMGISYLNYQSLPQKIVFIGGIIAGVAINLIGTFIFNISINVSIFLTLIPILIGVAFGCNYNEDLSLIRYFKLLISKTGKKHIIRSQSRIWSKLHNAAARIREEEELRKEPARKDV